MDFLQQVGSGSVCTVADLNREVRRHLEALYEGIWVEAEAVDVTRARSGHIYFTLADPGGNAQIRAVMWKGHSMRYGSRIIAGAGLRCHGRVTLYEARGTYQLVVDRVEQAGAGIKAQILAELKAKLAAEGLFSPERKRPIPPFPSCVGVVTSRTGAAFRDIVKVINRRFPVRIVLAHAQVQGESAPKEIVSALDLLARYGGVDTVIVGRGGGASEDLDAFNAEEVVRAVANHPKPVISAVGHEIDLTLVDLAADRRAATPSEAAEMAVPDGRALSERIAQETDSLVNAMERCIAVNRHRLSAQAGRIAALDPRAKLRRGVEVLSRARAVLDSWPRLVMTEARSELLSLRDDLERWPVPALARARMDLMAYREPLARWPDLRVAQIRADLSRLAAHLQALSPLASLARGYALVRREPDKRIVRDADQALPGTKLDITLARGRLECKVERAHRKETP